MITAMFITIVANTVSPTDRRQNQAEGEGFEPPRACALPVFKCGEYRPTASLMVPSGALPSGLTMPVVPLDPECARLIPES